MLSAAAAAAPQRHLANRHAMRVSGSSSYAMLFLLIYFRLLFNRLTSPGFLYVRPGL